MTRSRTVNAPPTVARALALALVMRPWVMVISESSQAYTESPPARPPSTLRRSNSALERPVTRTGQPRSPVIVRLVNFGAAESRTWTAWVLSPPQSVRTQSVTVGEALEMCRVCHVSWPPVKVVRRISGEPGPSTTSTASVKRQPSTLPVEPSM
ncbi:hypothetical protein SUDANB123_04469 [Nocardiopsis dassonvillei]